MFKRRFFRTILPITLMTLGIVSFVYGIHFRSFSVDQEVTRTIEIPPPEMPPADRSAVGERPRGGSPMPQPEDQDPMMQDPMMQDPMMQDPMMQDPMMQDPMTGGPMQDPMMPPSDFPGAFPGEPRPPQTIEITEMVTEKVGEKALVEDATIGGIKAVAGRLVRTYSPGQAPATCPT